MGVIPKHADDRFTVLHAKVNCCVGIALVREIDLQDTTRRPRHTNAALVQQRQVTCSQRVGDLIEERALLGRQFVTERGVLSEHGAESVDAVPIPPVFVLASRPPCGGARGNTAVRSHQERIPLEVVNGQPNLPLVPERQEVVGRQFSHLQEVLQEARL